MGEAHVAAQTRIDSKDGPSVKIHFISRDNGAGLTTDMNLLEEVLVAEGHDVLRVDWTSRSMPHCDVGIFLELLQPRLLPMMSHAVGIFNLEWFMTQWRRYINNMTQVWAKSEESLEVYKALGLNKKATLTGFLSRDLYDPSHERSDKCLHLKGHSDLKNTPAVLEAWRRHPGLPELTIVSNNVVEDLPDNVRLLRHVPREQLVQLMNESYIHICPSRAEGWGHYITEGLSTGAMVITTNASPMNEQVYPEWGMLLEPTARHGRGMVHEYDVDPDAIAEAVFASVALNEQERQRRSLLARQHIANRNEMFRKTMVQLLGEL